ncbi:cytochrome c family protein [bacterium]|nr:cytochrome c family protein [bacterium]
MVKRLLLIGFVLMAVANVVLIRANMRLGYNIEAKIKQPPKVHVFQTQYKGGTQIVFDHETHVQGYGLECIECHHVESCDHCHSKEINMVEVEELKVALHKNCLNCHRAMEVGPRECDECHKQ